VGDSFHQSTWSDAADAVLMLQRKDDLDVITIDGPFGTMRFKDVAYAHYKNPTEAVSAVQNVDLEKSRKYQDGVVENKVHLMRRSALLGLSESEVARMMADVAVDTPAGKTNQVAKIDIPLDAGQANRWYLLYRPHENIIWIYESKSKKLFKYKGFDPIK
jgi:hypothetical protein